MTVIDQRWNGDTELAKSVFEEALKIVNKSAATVTLSPAALVRALEPEVV